MTPKIPNKNPSFLEWAPGQNEPAADPADCSNCHPTPKKKTAFDFKSDPKPFFIDLYNKDLPPPAIPLPAVTAPPALKTTPSSPTLKPGAPKDAAALNDQAKELERQARVSMEPEKKIGFYQSALAFRLLGGDVEASHSVLNELDGLYKKTGNETGQKFVAANRLWVDGKPDEALKALADLKKDAQGESWDFYQAYASVRSLLLQSVAGEKLRNEDYTGAKPLLLEALVLTPSDQLTSKVLRLMAQNGDAGLQHQSQELSDLQAERDRLTSPPAKCNTGCHTATDDKKFNDFSNFDSRLGGPDLSAYRDLRHLSYPQKVQLHALDAKISAARTRFDTSLDAVKNILFVKAMDDPKQPIADLETKMLRGVPAFSDPDRSLPYHLTGEAYLAKKDYAKAAVALQAAVREDPSQIDAQFSLGKAQFATGDFKASRDAYTAILEHQPQDVIALKYRADANSHYLAALDPKVHATEITTVQAELASDRAMLLARYSANEKEKIIGLGKQLDLLREGSDVPLETRQETLDMMEMMAKQYLALAETKQNGIANTELVRKELNGLAAQTFDLLAKFAKADSDPAIKNRAGLYEGYSLLAQGKVDEAVKIFQPYRKDFPEIEKILGTLEKNQLRMVNLAALDAWAVYNKEGAQVQGDAQHGIVGGSIGLIEGAFRSDGKDFRDDTAARWKGQVAFVAELRSRIESGKADTILKAMEQIQTEGPESMKADATSYINYEDKIVTGYPLGALVHLVDKLPPDKGEAEALLHKTWDLERQNPAIETPYAFYTLVNHLDPEVSFNGTARQHMDALEGKGSFGQSVFKFITSMSPESLAVDVALMVGSAGLGNLAKLAALSKLEKAGITGYKAIVLAGAAGVGVEATALWAGNLGKEAMTKDPSKVFTQDHMLKSYGATLIMIGGLKGAGALGESLAPRAAKSLGLVTEGGTKLTAGGKVLTWSIGHGTGLGGMIGTSHLNQAIGLTPKPIGGWKEGLVHDVFGYVQFAVAHKMADGIFGGKLSTLSNKQHSEIAVRESIALAKAQADTMGFPATRGAKGEIVDSPARQLIVGLLVDSSLNRPGFSGGKLAKLIESRNFEKANDYFAEFGLPLEYSKSGELIAVARGEASPHAAAGIPAGKAKPVPKPLDVDLYAKQLGEKANALLDKAAEWLFGPPGDGGFGGMQPALAGAQHMVTPKVEPKGPPAVFMAGKGRGEKTSKTGKTGPVEISNPPAEKAANDNQYHEVIPYTLKTGESIDAVLLAMAKHFGDPTKIIVINCERPVENPEALQKKIEGFDTSARVEIHQPGGRPSIEVSGKTRMDQVHPDVLSYGQLLMWETGTKSVRELFEVKGAKGEILLGKPEGVSRIEIKAETALSKEDIVYLATRARDLGVTIEVAVGKDRTMTFESTASGFKIHSDKPTTPAELNSLVEWAVKAGDKIEVTTPDGKLEIKNGETANNSTLLTSDVKMALIAPDRITLVLPKTPTGAELVSLKTQGVQKILFECDTSVPGWIAPALEAIGQSKGVNIRANDPKGKLVWDNNVKSDGSNAFRSNSEVFRDALIAHVTASGAKNRLGEMQKLLGPEGSRFDFANDSLRWAASHDLADASIPKGKKDPSVTAEQFDAWLKRGQELAASKYGAAQDKSYASLVSELGPFANGFKTDPARPDGWTTATTKLIEFMNKESGNPALIGKVFEILNREPATSSAYENNAYDLAKFFGESENPYVAVNRLVNFYAQSKGQLKLEGNFFGSFFRNDTGAKAERQAVEDLISQAQPLIANGHEVVIEAIPTSKTLEGTTPDYSVTVSKGGNKTKYFVEVKRAASITVATGGSGSSFSADLDSGYRGQRGNDSNLATLIGKGLYQLNSYKGKNPGDNLILNVRLEGEPPAYVAEALKTFLAKNCPGVIVKLQYRSLEAATGTGSSSRGFVNVEVTYRADSASQYSSYDKNQNFFAPSLPKTPMAAGK